jgi:hypothetical protein
MDKQRQRNNERRQTSESLKAASRNWKVLIQGRSKNFPDPTKGAKMECQLLLGDAEGHQGPVFAPKPCSVRDASGC